MPSGFMMKGDMPSSGFESILKSGTSCPTHFAPFHQTSLRFLSHGFPDGSQEARL